MVYNYPNFLYFTSVRFLGGRSASNLFRQGDLQLLFFRIFFDITCSCNYNVIMKTSIVQIGNSKGVRIPKALLEQLKFEQTVEFEILPEGLLLRPVKEENRLERPRTGWTEMFSQALSEDGDDAEQFEDWNPSALTEFEETEW